MPDLRAHQDAGVKKPPRGEDRQADKPRVAARGHDQKRRARHFRHGEFGEMQLPPEQFGRVQHGRDEIDAVRLDRAVEDRPGARIVGDADAELEIHELFRWAMSANHYRSFPRSGIRRGSRAFAGPRNDGSVPIRRMLPQRESREHMRRIGRRRGVQIGVIELAEACDAEKAQRAGHFVFHDFEHAHDAGLPARRQRRNIACGRARPDWRRAPAP